MKKSFVVRVGGEAGQGIATAADVLAKVFIKLGYHIFASKDYASQIKGGHNYHTIRASEMSVHADVDKVDLLLALDKLTINEHLNSLNDKGIIIVDELVDLTEFEGSNKFENKKFIKVDVKQIETEIEQKNLHNAVFIGIAGKCLGIDFKIIEEELISYFSEKKKLQKILISAAELGYKQVKEIENIKDIKVKQINNKDHYQFLSGNDTLTLGALKAGVQFHVQYPMTPVSAVLHNLAKEAQTNSELTIVQPEDEIAAINFALGASYAGKRAMTATSGGGFALMIESLGLAGMAEVPLVLIEGQRPGPSTGLPTKTEQGDLKFVINSGTGDFPLAVIAPGDVDECYTETKRAFYLAEKYQLPVIVLVDKHIAESFKSVNLEKEEKEFVFDYNKRINMIENEDEVKDSQLNENKLYKRYAFGNEKRTIPGNAKGIYTCAGDEHDEVGAIIEDKEIRIKMMERRMSKLKKVAEEFPTQKLIGSSAKEAELTIVCWGSMKGAVLEAVEKFNEEGKKVNFLQVKYMFPFLSEEIKQILTSAKRLVLVENNYFGQLGDLIAEQTGIMIKDKILRSDGATFTIDEVYEQLRKRIERN